MVEGLYAFRCSCLVNCCSASVFSLFNLCGVTSGFTVGNDFGRMSIFLKLVTLGGKDAAGCLIFLSVRNVFNSPVSKIALSAKAVFRSR